MRSYPTQPTLLLCVLAAMMAVGGCHRPKDGSIDIVVIGNGVPSMVDAGTAALSEPDAVLVANAAQGLVRFDPKGQIEAGLAERWNVSDDGLSYIFRLQSGKWPSGKKIDARDIARLLNRARRGPALDQLRDTLGAIDEIVAMTDRVIEIRLSAPRPHLLQLLAQPDFAVAREGVGTGPFLILPGGASQSLHLRRLDPGADGEPEQAEDIRLAALPAPSAVAAFVAGKADLVLGGGYSDLPVALQASLPRGSLRFDPVAGLFALMPGNPGGALADARIRSLLSRVIDREALVTALKVDGLAPRYTLLQPGLDGVPSLSSPPWSAVPLARRAIGLAAEADRLFGKRPRPTLAIGLPAGPGSTIIFDRLDQDFRKIGVLLRPARPGEVMDLRLIDEVAPSTSPAWFVRRFACGRVPVCEPSADKFADQARSAQTASQRAELLVAAAQLLDDQTIVIPLTAPVRWSLVSVDAPGFSENRFARHTFINLGHKAPGER